LMIRSQELLRTWSLQKRTSDKLSKAAARPLLSEDLTRLRNRGLTIYVVAPRRECPPPHAEIDCPGALSPKQGASFFSELFPVLHALMSRDRTSRHTLAKSPPKWGCQKVLALSTYTREERTYSVPVAGNSFVRGARLLARADGPRCGGFSIDLPLEPGCVCDRQQIRLARPSL
jgi:hypothetical protein